MYAYYIPIPVELHLIHCIYYMCSVASDWLVFLIKAYLYPSTEVHPCVSFTRTFEAVLLCWYIWSLVIGFYDPSFFNWIKVCTFQDYFSKLKQVGGFHRSICIRVYFERIVSTKENLL